MPLRHPFTIQANGRAAVLDDDSDEAAAQEIAFLLLTRPGERPLLPEYGTPDPTYDTTGSAALAAQVAAFGPTVNVTDVTQTAPSDTGTSDLTVTFTR